MLTIQGKVLKVDTPDNNLIKFFINLKKQFDSFVKSSKDNKNYQQPNITL